MEATRTVLVLLMSKQPGIWLSSSLADEFEFHICADARDVIKTLRNIRCDLSILDDDLFGDRTASAIQEFKHLFPSIPIILLSDSTDQAHRARFAQAGTDAFLAKSAPASELRQLIQLLFDQHRQNRSLAQLNHKLHLLTSLPRLLYGQPNTYELLLQASKLLRSLFRLYGVAFLFQESDGYRLYAGSEEIADRNRLHECVLRPDQNDPFLWTMRSGAMQIYEDITRNRNFTPIPILEGAKATAIIPLVHKPDISGAMGIFLADGDILAEEDLVIYEQFGAHMIVALRNVYQSQAQSVSVQSSQHLLRAWQQLISIGSAAELGRELCKQVEDIAAIGRAMVWLNTNAAGVVQDMLVDTQNSVIVDNLNAYSPVLSQKLTGLFNETLQPVLIERDITRDPALESLFDLLQARQLVIMPISDTVRFLGSIVAGTVDGQTLDTESINLLRNLSYTAGALIERATLTSAVEDKSSRLEAILCSISEGIFFVDENNKVAFCNPQIAELTSINSSKVLLQASEVLLRDLADATDEPAQTYAQLLAAQKAVVEQGRDEGYCPIIGLALPKQERDVNVEFVRTVGSEHQKVSWVGIIRDNSRAGSSSQILHSLINSMSESFRLPYAQMRGLIATLADHHGRFNYHERDNLISRIRAGIVEIGKLWDSLLEIYDLQTGNIALDRQVMDIQLVVQSVVESVQTSDPRKRIGVAVEPDLPWVKVDEFRVERALTAVVQRAIDDSPPDYTIEVRLERHNQDVLITVHHSGSDLTAEKLEQLFESVNPKADTDRTDFDLYLAREVINRHGGRVWAENSQEGASIRVLLPAVGLAKPAESKGSKISYPDAAEDDDVVAAPRGIRVPSRVPRTIMFVEGQSAIGKRLLSILKESYEVLTYRSGEEALKDVNMIHVDLVVMDTIASEDSRLDVCRHMRKFTEVPIILIADKAPDTGKVQGLNAGADDYITAPVSEDELVARVQAIFKRQHIPERTSEPLSVGNLCIDSARREVFVSSKPVELTRIEFDLLYTLAANRDAVLTHRQLLEKVWGPDYTNETHYLWVSISRLRKKLEAKDNETQYIHNQPGVGYYFNAA